MSMKGFTTLFFVRTKNATTVPSIPFPLDDCVFVSHLSMHSVNICMILWNSNEQALEYVILVALCNTKSAKQSSSAHFEFGSLCWKIKIDIRIDTQNTKYYTLENKENSILEYVVITELQKKELFQFGIFRANSPNYEACSRVSLWSCICRLVLYS